ncbi:TetR/AcrR family transcriptional regulator [Cellulosimicrobium marinum]|uniref:TetR/AcrR family transcriptional regulator n=1 Tax=Cellulosimicrobium marinum TaxID=1638992 RepID=UPI001E622E12|nr:TetR/AcrR family transcriptional regulator [Cellulosimicrobium marinum]MCB7135026.1 TetR/AcrR family transcriptional regulator [Cellulosimicrobium marinum]
MTSTEDRTDEPAGTGRPRGVVAAADAGVTSAVHAAERAREQFTEVVRTPEITRRLALLWDPPAPATRGRKARLTLDEVVDAGIAVAQEGGLDALSMRRVATELGVGAMSLYTYVPGRTELVDLMIDRAYAELDLPEPGAPWRAALTQYAHETWNLYLRHPWVLQTNMWRAPLAPHVLDAQEAGLRSIIDTGLSEVQVAETLGLVDNYVQGLARSTVAETAESDATGIGNDEYWTTLGSFWEDWFDVERYPAMTRIYVGGGFDAPQGPFGPSLDRLLDAVEMAIDRANATAQDPDPAT